MNEQKLFHLGIDVKNYRNSAKYAILPGAPERVGEIANYLYEPEIVAQNREFKTVFGYVSVNSNHNDDIPVFICSTGIGGPSAAIAVEELAMLGVENFIRVGTCGGIDISVSGGDIVIATSSVRQEGTSLHYAPIEFPATADFFLTMALVEGSRNLGFDPHIGVIQCKDSFYGQHNPDRMPVSTELKEKWEAWKRLGVLASEMESSTIFCVAASLGLKAAMVLSVVWNQERAKAGLSNGEIHDNEQAIKIAIEGIKISGCRGDNMSKRVFLMVMDSVGIGNAPDADLFEDTGANTLKSCYETGSLHIDFLKRLGIFNIDGINFGEKENNPIGIYGRLIEKSADKDTITGHREMMGIISDKRMPTFPNGFPDDFVKEFEKRIKRKVLCNKPYSGTEVLKDYGREHINTGNIIVYTSGDSVFQIAVHTGIISVEELYEICEIAREMLKGDLAVGRVIARPFAGAYPNFERISRLRHDYSLPVTEYNILNKLLELDVKTIAVGKISDIFANYGFNESYHTGKNNIGFKKCFELLNIALDNSFSFVNFVGFDADFGHRRNPVGYAECLNEFDGFLKEFVSKMRDEDLLIVTADHGCDPCFAKTTDHTRECVPVLVYGKCLNLGNNNLGTLKGFDNIGKMVENYFRADKDIIFTV